MADSVLPGLRPGVLLRTLSGLPKGRVVRRLARPLRGIVRRCAYRAGAGPGRVEPAGLTRIAPPHLPDAGWTPPGRFEFVGIVRDLGSSLDWTVAPTRLWAFHLHSLDALREDHSAADRLLLLDGWLAANPFASRPGWESFPLSLRIVNALEFLLVAGDRALASRAESLALQAWWLEANLETDLGANHLWKNALALVWAGRCFRGQSPHRWRLRGDGLVERELAAQILSDGFHVERSPGYHAVLVDDLVRLERLLAATGEGDAPIGRLVTDARRRTAAALASVVHPDGEIPLFNDAAFGQAPRAAWLLDRAAERDDGARPVTDPRGAPAAGIHRLTGDNSVVLFDAGEIGCDDQPGHAHADTLSYEMSYELSRVVVDAGVFDYEPSAERAYARSTRSHNTLELDGLDQSEMWGVFRVGRRAHVLGVRRDDRDGRATIEASHDGYAHLAGRPVHRRRLEHLGGDAWSVEDVVLGSGVHRAVSRVRLHPAFARVAHADGWLEASDGRVVARVVAESPGRVAIEQGRYFPRFGVEETCLVARFEASGELPLRICYRVLLSTRF